MERKQIFHSTMHDSKLTISCAFATVKEKKVHSIFSVSNKLTTNLNFKLKFFFNVEFIFGRKLPY